MAIDTDTAFEPVHLLSQRLASRQLRAEQLVEGYLIRIERYEPALRAFVSVYAQEALRAARAADQAMADGTALGPLHGIPIAVKDLLDVAGRITTGGSLHWKDRVSTVTAAAVRRCIAAGVVLIGKNHTVEFAMSPYGMNRHMGTPRNPWDMAVHRAPGGSSSGTGVAVAAGLVPWGIGTDTGGSVRTPAAWCGLSSLRPTVGRIDTFGVLPISQTLDTVGPMCRDVEDCALLLRLLQGSGSGDEGLMGVRWDDPTRDLHRGVDGLVLARLPAPDRESCDSRMLEAYDEALAELARQGAVIVDLALPHALTDLSSRVMPLASVEAYAHLGALVDDPSLPLDDMIRPLVQAGRDVKAVDYLARLREREQVQHSWLAAFSGVDAILTPTTPRPAPRLEDIDPTVAPGHLTRPFSYLGWCALALPCGATTEGLPLSLQVACPPAREATALRIGAAFQRATAWHRRRPALSATGD
jgi:aspartyl-tRNA(Asn)/glutamyl-tRNA(Gln) amidotransferase subunit A